MKAGIALMKDPKDTKQLFKVTEVLNRSSNVRGYDKLLLTGNRIREKNEVKIDKSSDCPGSGLSSSWRQLLAAQLQ